MKTLKYLVAGIMALSLSAPAMAQVDQAALGQVKNIIASKVDVDKQIKGIVKEFKKNPAMLTAIGRAFLEAKDVTNATKYAEMALARDRKFRRRPFDLNRESGNRLFHRTAKPRSPFGAQISVSLRAGFV